MNLVRPRGRAALTALCVLAVILLGTGCGAVVPGGSSVPGASGASNRTSTGQPGAAADSGMAGCTALLGAHQAATKNYPRIRSQFAHSRWPDLRAAGMSYVDLVVRLQTARADGYETVWFHQRLSAACARHGWKYRPGCNPGCSSPAYGTVHRSTRIGPDVRFGPTSTSQLT